MLPLFWKPWRVKNGSCDGELTATRSAGSSPAADAAAAAGGAVAPPLVASNRAAQVMLKGACATGGRQCSAGSSRWSPAWPATPRVSASPGRGTLRVLVATDVSAAASRTAASALGVGVGVHDVVVQRHALPARRAGGGAAARAAGAQRTARRSVKSFTRCRASQAADSIGAWRPGARDVHSEVGVSLDTLRRLRLLSGSHVLVSTRAGVSRLARVVALDAPRGHSPQVADGVFVCALNPGEVTPCGGVSDALGWAQVSRMWHPCWRSTFSWCFT